MNIYQILHLISNYLMIVLGFMYLFVYVNILRGKK